MLRVLQRKPREGRRLSDILYLAGHVKLIATEELITSLKVLSNRQVLDHSASGK